MGNLPLPLVGETATVAGIHAGRLVRSLLLPSLSLAFNVVFSILNGLHSLQ